MRWTRAEMEFLERNAANGASWLAAALGRSKVAVQSKASRMGVSLVYRWTCPRCGRASFQTAGRNGWCRTCELAEQADRAITRNARIRAEIKEERGRIKREEQRRQKAYAETNRLKSQLRRISEER